MNKQTQETQAQEALALTRENLEPKLMPEIVLAALHIWLSGANINNSFTPLSDEKTAKALSETFAKTPPYSKTTICRWRAKYNFKAHLENMAATAIASDDDAQKTLEKSANKAIVEKAIDDFAMNREIMANCYAAMKDYTGEIVAALDAKKPVSMERMRLAVEIFKVTSVREDKMFDRQVISEAANRLSKDDALKNLIDAAIVMEDDEDE
jgi:hypothetical protein